MDGEMLNILVLDRMCKPVQLEMYESLDGAAEKLCQPRIIQVGCN
jgi:hypothetical protein